MSIDSPDVRRATWAAMFVAIVMIGQQLAGKALRDGFFLTHFEASALPTVMTSASLLSVAIVLGSVQVFRRFEPAKSIPYFFAFSACLYVLEWALSGPEPRLAAAALYLHTTSFGAVVVSGFWSIINERFDPHTARQVIGRIAGGATLGGVLGGLAAWRGAAMLSIPTMILVLAGLNAVCMLGLRAIGRPARPHADSDLEVSALEIFQETPYLRQLALLVGLAAFAGAVYDYVFKQQAAAYFGGGPELVSFFALFYLVLGVVTFFVQNLLARRWLAWLGLAFTVATLPGAIVLLGAAALLLPGLATAVTLRGGTNVVESSLYRSGYELLYTPLLPEKKRPTKTLVDVGGDKLGAAVGGGVAFFVLGIFPAAATPILICFGVAAGAAALLVTRQLHRGYVASLAESLRTGAINLSEDGELDATERQALNETLIGVQRSAVLEELSLSDTHSLSQLSREELLDLLRSRSESRQAGSSERTEPYVAPARSAPVELDEMVLAIAELRSGDAQRIERVMRRHNPLPPVLVPHIVPLLEKEDTRSLTLEPLRRVAPAHVGFLLDRLLQIRTPLPVRRAICAILGNVATERSAEGLTALLRDPEFELRFAAAAGLLRIYSANAKLKPAKQLFFEAAEREARDCERSWSAQSELAGRLYASGALDSPSGRRVTHGLTYIFSLLLTVLDRGALQLAIRALADANAAHRGTGLEYLDNVLPPNLRQSLWPLLQDGDLARATLRDRSEILQEIISLAPPSEVDLALLRERVDAKRRERGLPA